MKRNREEKYRQLPELGFVVETIDQLLLKHEDTIHPEVLLSYRNRSSFIKEVTELIEKDSFIQLGNLFLNNRFEIEELIDWYTKNCDIKQVRKDIKIASYEKTTKENYRTLLYQVVNYAGILSTIDKELLKLNNQGKSIENASDLDIVINCLVDTVDENLFQTLYDKNSCSDEQKKHVINWIIEMYYIKPYNDSMNDFKNNYSENFTKIDKCINETVSLIVSHCQNREQLRLILNAFYNMMNKYLKSKSDEALEVFQENSKKPYQKQ